MNLPNENALLTVNRLPELRERYPELKDPSIIRPNPGIYLMYASIGDSGPQRWIMGRFMASNLTGVWMELPPVQLIGLEGPEVCAPAMTFNPNTMTGRPYEMYVQTGCFRAETTIDWCDSADGETFTCQNSALISAGMITQPPAPVIGVYDAGISTVLVDGTPCDCLVYSAYRRVGCGDVYVSTRRHDRPADSWSAPALILKQEDVPFHNHPDDPNFEWGLEGAQITQLPGGGYLLTGVCFLRGNLHPGHRQRVFMAISRQVTGPYMPVTTPIEPQSPHGENGHPDVFIEHGQVWVVFQERDGVNAPWYLRAARFDAASLSAAATSILSAADSPFTSTGF